MTVEQETTSKEDSGERDVGSIDSEQDSLTIEMMPEALNDFKKVRKRELQSLKRYREKLTEASQELRGLLHDKDQILKSLDDQDIRLGIIVEQADAHLASAEGLHTQLTDLVSQSNDLLSEGEELKPRLESLSSSCEEIEEIAQNAAKRSQHIEDGFLYVQKTRPIVEQAAADVNDARSRVLTITEDVTERKGRIEAIEESIQGNHDSAIESVESVENLVGQFEKRNGQVEDQQNLLQSLLEKADALAERVESLLPGATSAGLASAFENNANELTLSIRIWEAISVISLVGLTAYGLFFGLDIISTAQELTTSTGTETAGTAINPWTIGVMAALKSLVAIPIVWLVLFAGHRGSKQKRVREDYRYKAALAKVFQGFKEQLSDIDTGKNSPVVGLSNNVLNSFAAQPGRLYDAKHQEVTPLSAFADAISAATKGKKSKIQTPGASAEVEDISDASDSNE